MKPVGHAERRMRWWIPICLIAVSATLITSLQFAETNFRPHKTALVVILTSLLLALWYIFLTGFSLRARLARLALLFAAVAATGVVLKKFTRIEGTYTGSGFPRLVWKWTPKPDANLPGVMTAVSSRATPAMTSAGPGTDFPEFLGPGRTNFLSGLRLAVTEQGDQPKELWRRPVGLGWSGFAIVAGRAVTQEQRGENELVVCYDLLTGAPLWARTNQARFSEMLGGDGPRATPTISSNRVYALGATGLLDCLDLSGGQLVWSHDTLKENHVENIMWGKSCSPLVLEGLVVVTGGDSGPLLLAFDKDSGAPVWRGGNGTASYASPVLATLAGRRQILSVNAHSVTSHDPDNGIVLWEYAWPGDFPKCSQPVALPPNRIFISAGYGIGSVLLQVNAETEGRLSVREVWKNRNLKTQFTNVALRDGFAYGLDDGILCCVELESGQRRWKEGRYGHGQTLLVGDVLLVQTEPGSIVLVEANPNGHRELGHWTALHSKTWNNPALSGKYLLVRNDREMVCLEIPLRP